MLLLRLANCRVRLDQASFHKLNQDILCKPKLATNTELHSQWTNPATDFKPWVSVACLFDYVSRALRHCAVPATG
jgi:hypothetical protein